MEIGEIYFWTATINNWQHLLKSDNFKNIIISSLEFLTMANLIDVFAFVIMPNHIHLIWKIKGLNGKETTIGSFLKYTAHEFKKLAKTDMNTNLENFKVDAPNKNFEFWKGDSLPIRLNSREIAYQKLDYIHWNPCQEHWKLAIEPIGYRYSSAKFYELDVKEYSFLKDLRKEF